MSELKLIFIRESAVSNFCCHWRTAFSFLEALSLGDIEQKMAIADLESDLKTTTNIKCYCNSYIIIDLISQTLISNQDFFNPYVKGFRTLIV